MITKNEHPMDYKALLLMLLSLPPEATDEEIAAKAEKTPPAAERPASGDKDKGPPTPKHDPTRDTDPDPQRKVELGNALIADIRKEGRFTDYSSARAEARRRRPELFQ